MKTTALLLLLLCSGLLTPLEAKPYKGAEIRTHDSYLYGRFEVRIRSAAGAGLLSSFFTFHDTGILPAQWNEIDIESLGRYEDETQFNIISLNQTGHEVHQPLAFNPHLDFHVLAFEWTPDYVAWFVDGSEVYREIGAHVQELTFPQKIMFNIWPPTSVAWAGVLDPGTLPVYAFYDWVRYSAYTPETPERFTLQWQDDFDQFYTSRWGKASHTFDGNNCDFIPANAVTQDGYAIICLTPDGQSGYAGGAISDDDVTSPYPVWVRLYRGYVLAQFSEPLQPSAAEDINNFIIPSVTVQQATLLDDQRTVQLNISGADTSTTYNVIANNILDIAGNNSGLKIKPTIAPLTFPIAVNVGGDRVGHFLAEQTYTAQLEYGAVGGRNVSNDDSRDFLNTDQDEIFRRERRDFRFYQTRLENGSYRVRLWFAETEHSGAGERVFNIFAETVERENALDIYQRAGGEYRAVFIDIPGVVINDGMLDLYFQAVVGETALSGIEIFREVTAIDDGAHIPQTFEWSIFPNPFNPSTTIQYRLENASQVEIRLYNTLGQVVDIIDNRFQEAGLYRENIFGYNLSSGLYFVEIRLDGIRRGLQKAVLVR